MTPQASSRTRTTTVAALLLLLLVSATASTDRSWAGPAPWFGALQVQPKQDDALSGLGLTAATVEVSWDELEPRPDVVDPVYVAAVRDRVATLAGRGRYVVLDLGLQYPPAWVFDLPGSTRFVDQYGTTWTGVAGTAIADAVFNPAVRAVQGRYVRRLAAELDGAGVDAVRVGGLTKGALSYPPAPASGSPILWMYGSDAQTESPAPGWRPGTGDRAQARHARQALEYYLGSITGYGGWLLGEAGRGFPAADLHLLLPSWGLRPGQLDSALARDLGGSTPGELTGAVTQGLDWAAQTALLTRFGQRGTAFTTWLDAPDQGRTPSSLSPVEYLVTLTGPLGLGLAGQNTGGSDPAALQLCLERVRTLHLRGMQWMTAADLLADSALARQYADGASVARGGG